MEHNPQLAALPAVIAAQAAACAANDLHELEAAILAFDAHPIAAGTRAVPGRKGDRAGDHPLMLLGKSPAARETELGIPFQGPIAQTLRRAVNLAGHDVEEAYQTHVTYWRPRKDNLPNATQIAFSRPFIRREIEFVRPRCIVALGAAVMDSLYGEHTGLTERAGERTQWNGTTCYVSRNHGYYARFPKDMDEFVETLRHAWDA